MVQFPSDLHRHLGLVAQIADGAQKVEGAVFGMEPHKNHDLSALRSVMLVPPPGG